jgi:hypothetical protein
MKDLILITAYCPDDNRENILRDCVYSLSKFREKYDIMIVSHTPIPVDIQKQVNYCFYDSKNEILTDWDLLNRPWFSPSDGRAIHSSFLSKKNTILAIWRMFILGFANAKNLGYTKVHQIEYDCKIVDDTEILSNSELLGSYDSVVYFDLKPDVENLLFGSFQSYYIPTMSNFLLELDEEGIKEYVRTSDTKSPEVLLYRILSNGKIFEKNRDLLELNGNKFGVFDGQITNSLNSWSVPFYDEQDDHIYFIVWNTKVKEGIKHQIILNKTKVVSIDLTPLNHWKIIDLGFFDDIKDIIVVENKQIRDTFSLNTEDEQMYFKKMSYRNRL